MAYSKKILIMKRLHWLCHLLEASVFLFIVYATFSVMKGTARGTFSSSVDTNGATVLLYYIVFSNTLQALYQDKSNKMTDILRIMGLKWTSYLFSYLAVEFSAGSVFTALTCYLSVSLKGYDGDKAMKFVLSASVFLLSNIMMAFLLVSCVSNSRLGNFLAIILLIFSLAIYEVLIYTTTKWWHHLIFALIPYCSFAETLKCIYSGSADPGYAVLVIKQLVPLGINVVLVVLIKVFSESESVLTSCSSCLERKAKREESSDELLSSSVLLKAEDIYKQYGSFYALNGVTLEMSQGEIFGLLGPNGAGKTTFINILLNNLAPSSGTLRIHKNSLSTGYCPQATILFEELTPAQHLELFASIKEEAHPNLGEILEVLRLGDSRDKQAAKLSGGQRRKLTVAMAFVGKADLIVLDEPTVGMDAESRLGLWKLIRENRRDRLIVLTTQNLEEADELSDRIAILSSGTLVDHPQPSIEWKKKYGYGYKLVVEADSAAQLAHATNVVHSFVSAKPVAEHEELGKTTFNLPSPELKTYQELFAKLEEAKGVKMTLEYSTLEDAYLNVAGQKREAARPSSPKSELDILVLNGRGERGLVAQFAGLINVRWLVIKRNWKRWIESSIPLMLIFIASFVYFYDEKSYIMQYIIARVAIPFITVAYGCMLPTAIYVPVLEKQKSLIQVLEINGVNKAIYWTSYILSELVVSAIVILMTHLILFVMYL